MNPRPPGEAPGLFEGLRLGPILIGALIDHVATLVIAALLLGSVAPEALEDGLTQELADRLSASLPYLLGSVAGGAACTVLGAFAAARLAGRLFVSHGGWVAVTATVLSLGYLIPPSDPALASQPQIQIPLWIEALSWLLILPAGIAGGLLARALAGGEPEP